jgi:hypothetical protein
MICTFVHAVVVLAVVGEIRKCYTAGDDGGAVLMCSLILTWEGMKKPVKGNQPSDDVSVLFYALSLLGLIQWSKVFTSQEAGAIALKRPLRQVEREILTPPMVVWPQSILIQMFIQWREHRDPRFYTYYMFNTRKDCRSAIITEVTRFLSAVSAMEHRASDADLQVVMSYCEYIYATLNLPYDGLVPQFSRSTYTEEFVPCLRGGVEMLRKDPIERTIKHLWQNRVFVPERAGESDHKEKDLEFYVGEKAVSRKTALISWLLKLGYAGERSLVRSVDGEAGYSLLMREYDQTVRLPHALYEITINNLPPCMIAHA